MQFFKRGHQQTLPKLTLFLISFALLAKFNVDNVSPKHLQSKVQKNIFQIYTVPFFSSLFFYDDACKEEQADIKEVLTSGPDHHYGILVIPKF